MVGTAALLLALPLWSLFWFCETVNDKPYGWHANPVGYGIIGFAAASVVAAVAWALVSAAVPARPRAGECTGPLSVWLAAPLSLAFACGGAAG